MDCIALRHTHLISRPVLPTAAWQGWPAGCQDGHQHGHRKTQKTLDDSPSRSRWPAFLSGLAGGGARPGQTASDPPQKPGKLANSVFFRTQPPSPWALCQPWQTQVANWQTQRPPWSAQRTKTQKASEPFQQSLIDGRTKSLGTLESLSFLRLDELVRCSFQRAARLRPP
jgi:hypothetical protein